MEEEFDGKKPKLSKSLAMYYVPTTQHDVHKMNFDKTHFEQELDTVLWKLTNHVNDVDDDEEEEDC